MQKYSSYSAISNVNQRNLREDIIKGSDLNLKKNFIGSYQIKLYPENLNALDLSIEYYLRNLNNIIEKDRRQNNITYLIGEGAKMSVSFDQIVEKINKQKFKISQEKINEVKSFLELEFAKKNILDDTSLNKDDEQLMNEIVNEQKTIRQVNGEQTINSSSTTNINQQNDDGLFLIKQDDEKLAQFKQDFFNAFNSYKTQCRLLYSPNPVFSIRDNRAVSATKLIGSVASMLPLAGGIVKSLIDGIASFGQFNYENYLRENAIKYNAVMENVYDKENSLIHMLITKISDHNQSTIIEMETTSDDANQKKSPYNLLISQILKTQSPLENFTAIEIELCRKAIYESHDEVKNLKTARTNLTKAQDVADIIFNKYKEIKETFEKNISHNDNSLEDYIKILPEISSKKEPIMQQRDNPKTYSCLPILSTLFKFLKMNKKPSTNIEITNGIPASPSRSEISSADTIDGESNNELIKEDSRKSNFLQNMFLPSNSIKKPKLQNIDEKLKSPSCFPFSVRLFGPKRISPLI